MITLKDGIIGRYIDLKNSYNVIAKRGTLGVLFRSDEVLPCTMSTNNWNGT
jgi:hypothetical protein